MIILFKGMFMQYNIHIRCAYLSSFIFCILITIYHLIQANQEVLNHNRLNRSTDYVTKKRIPLGSCQLCKEMVKSLDNVSKSTANHLYSINCLISALFFSFFLSFSIAIDCRSNRPDG